ncbi:hypothetical protein KVR01_007562 [Diaporthe batatas]|uniref:uncharacterized protein n=1 Tax=Diaporthe batatas TaxID=748121 RepID=UPI001D052E9C|nr:uncharacterized protein KVR01_007562 [Diaporthe batatas]KAG8163084.1 hypothetical protein KVR01_007562 [Diaporthe batatas]
MDHGGRFHHEEPFGHESRNSFFDQEGLVPYRPGGYHPVSLGDCFKEGRYQVHHKLGWGGFSTVWLAKDKIRDEWVALKVLAARVDQEKSSREISILRELSNSPDAAQTCIVRLLDDFHHTGPNGRHQCLVLELLGPSLINVIDGANPMPGQPRGEDDGMIAEDIFRVARQLLSALAVLHENGIAHGDISSHNVAFCASNIRHASEEDVLGVVGTPVVEDLIREDGQPVEPRFPKHLVRRAEWFGWVGEGVEDIRLADWGESFRLGEEPPRLAQPADCKAPETIFTERLDYRVDLWRAGLVIYHMAIGYKPFGAYREDAFLVSQMIGFIEDLPDEWKGKWRKMKEESEESYDDVDPDSHWLEKRFDELVQDPRDPSLRPLLPVIKGLMRFRPSDRLSAAQALELVPEIDPEPLTEVKSRMYYKSTVIL